MKLIKKYILIIAVALLTISLSACGTKVTAEEAINKVAETNKNIKNAEFTSNVTTEFTSNNQTRKTEAKVSGTMISDPLALYAKTDITSPRKTSLDMYIKDNVIYVKNGDSSAWLKSSDPKLLSQFEKYKQITSSDKVMNFYKKLGKDFKITEENGNYVLTYNGSGDQFKELMTALSESSGGQLNSKAINNVDFKNVDIKYVVTKDFNIVSGEVKMEVASKSTSNPQTLKLVQTITYAKINQVNSIDLPEEAKNAKEINKISR